MVSIKKITVGKAKAQGFGNFDSEMANVNFDAGRRFFFTDEHNRKISSFMTRKSDLLRFYNNALIFQKQGDEHYTKHGEIKLYELIG